MGPQLLEQIAVGSINVSGANAIYYRPLLPVRVLKTGFIVTTVIGSAAIVITGAITEADTTPANPTGAAALGTMTATSSSMAVNTGVWLDVQAVKGDRIVYPGEAISFSCTTTGTGVVQVVAVVEHLGFSNVDMRGHVTSHPGSTTLATALAAMTQVTA